jgi:alkylhydroperoxidase family enzyme
MSRIQMLTPEQAKQAAEEAGLPAAMADLNVFRVLLRRPRVAKAVNDLLFSLLFGAELDDRLRELVIMRIGWATGADYEWTQHWRVARETFHMSDAEVLAVRDWRDAPELGPVDRAVLQATDETLETGRIGPETWALCREHLDEDACLELTAAIGTWRMISQLARSVEFPLEEGVASWPPDGAVPPADGEPPRTAS